MELTYKEDYDACRKFWKGWWEEPEYTRPALVCVLEKPGTKPVSFPSPLTLLTGDIDVFCRQLDGWLESHIFPGDTLPAVVVSFGADHFAALMGIDLKLDLKNNTSWAEHCVGNWDHFKIRIDWNCQAAKRTLEVTRELRKRYEGKIMISPTHLQGNLDCLAALRGVQPLLYDLIDTPDKIRKALTQVDEAFSEVVEVFRQEYDTDTWGSVNRHMIYQPGFSGLLQCDFSCMISPAILEEFVLPSLRHEAETVDYAEYHLDGPGALVHVESICSIDKIKVIQWQPGDALLNDDWSELHRKIDGLGRGQYFCHPDAQKISWIKEKIKCRNCCLDLKINTIVVFQNIQNILKSC